MIDRLKELIGKKVFLGISQNRFYNGFITEVTNTHIHMIDKYNSSLIIAISEIKFVQEKEQETIGKNQKSLVKPTGITKQEKA